MSGSVFVSHSSRDAEFVARLAEHLRAAGMVAWIDQVQMRPGDRWEQVVRDRIDACQAVLVVMSPAAEASPHVANEVDRARRRGIPILPLLLAGEPFFALGTLHHGDVRGGVMPDERVMARLAEWTSSGPSGIPGPGRLPAGGPWPDQLVVGDLPGPVVAWQDRPALLEQVAGLARDGQTAVVCALAGQRGVGKTQLAAAYARMRIQQGWPVVVWAVAETADGIVTVLDEVATEAGVRPAGADPVTAARAAQRWLRSRPGSTLLVYDNAVDADLIRAWTPPIGSVHTVVTTTRQDLHGLGEVVDVDLFTPAEALTYLAQRTGLDDPSGAAELAAAVGWLPLALAQAGALIGPRRRYPTYTRYLDRVAGTSTDQLLPHTTGDPYPHGAAEAILLSVEDLSAADPHRRARRLLERLAVLAPIGAEGRLLRCLTTDADTDARTDDADLPVDGDAADVTADVVATLTLRSLAVPATDADRVLVHRLIQRVVRERCQHTGTLPTVIAQAGECLDRAAREIGRGWATRGLLAEYATHATAITGAATDDDTRRALLPLRQWILYWLIEVHHITIAIAFGQALLTDLHHLRGPNHPGTLTSRNNLANAYHAAGRVDEAIGLHEQTLTDRQRVLGPDHPDTLKSRNNLASAYQVAGRVDEAIGLHEQTLTDRRRVLGPDHPDTLNSRNNLAIAYRMAGRVDEAIGLHEQTLTDRQRVLGPDHRDTLDSRHRLAETYLAGGRVDEAIALYEQTLTDRRRIVGPDHPDTLWSRSSLATAYRVAGRVDEAIALHEQTLTDWRRIVGPDHPDTLRSRGNLASAYQAAGRVDEAIALHEQILTDQRRILGPDHPDTLSNRSNLAIAYQAAGRVDEAIALHEQTLTDRQRILGPDHPDTLRSRNNLANVTAQRQLP